MRVPALLLSQYLTLPQDGEGEEYDDSTQPMTVQTNTLFRIALEQSYLWTLCDLAWPPGHREVWRMRAGLKLISATVDLTVSNGAWANEPKEKLCSLRTKLHEMFPMGVRSLTSAYLPNIEMLSLISPSVSAIPVPLVANRLPRLRVLHLSGRFTLPLPSIGDCLEELTFDATSVSHLRHILESCSNLRKLQVGFEHAQSFYPEDRSIAFPQTLETLVMRNMSKRSLELVLRYLQPGELKCLDFEVFPGGFPWTEAQGEIWKRLVQPFVSIHFLRPL